MNKPTLKIQVDTSGMTDEDVAELERETKKYLGSIGYEEKVIISDQEKSTISQMILNHVQHGSTGWNREIVRRHGKILARDYTGSPSVDANDPDAEEVLVVLEAGDYDDGTLGKEWRDRDGCLTKDGLEQLAGDYVDMFWDSGDGQHFEIDNIVAESSLIFSGQIISGQKGSWRIRWITTYLRKYNLGPGPTTWGRAKYRYRQSDIKKAWQEMLAAEPKNEQGLYVDPLLALYQTENNL